MRKFWAGVLFVTILMGLVGTRAAWADVSHTTPQSLKSLGLNPERFVLAAFSPDGRSLLGSEPGTTEEIARGISYKIFLLSLRSDGRVTEARRYEIPEVVEQLSFTPDGQQVVMVARSGATWMVLDLKTAQVRTFMEHQAGQSGFRNHPPVLWHAGGKMLALGYFYDGNDFGGRNTITEIDPSQTGVAAFTQSLEVEPIERSFKNLAIHSYPAADRGFFCNREGDLYHLYRWVAGSQPVKVDQALRFTAYDAAGDRTAYSARRNENLNEVVLFDGATGTRQVLARSAEPFLYLTLSRDGSTILVTQLAGDKVDYLSASSRSGMVLKPHPKLPRARSGQVRMTVDGSRFCLYNSEGLRVVDLP